MNILIVPSWYPSNSNPVNGSFFREQAISLYKAGHRVIVINVTYTDKNEYLSSVNFKLKKDIDNGLIMYSLVTPSLGIVRTKRLIYADFYRKLNKVFTKIINDGEKIDIIHAHSFKPAGYCACKLGEKHNIPVVVTEHSSRIITNSLTHIEVKYLTDTIDRSSVFICVGEALKQKVSQITGSTKMIPVIPNMLSPLFQYKASAKKVDKNDFIFCSIGNLKEGKRFELTINAFAKAFKGSDHIKLQIIGGGHLYNHLKKQINLLDMNKQISLLGQLSREQIASKLQTSDAFVLASAYETFGVVYVEALVSGKPIIGAKNGGANWIINDDNGILIDKDNEEQLVSSMRYMVDNYNNYNPQNISQRTLSLYAELPIINKLNNIYEGCIQNVNR